MEHRSAVLDGKEKRLWEVLAARQLGSGLHS